LEPVKVQEEKPKPGMKITIDLLGKNQASKPDDGGAKEVDHLLKQMMGQF